MINPLLSYPKVSIPEMNETLKIPPYGTFRHCEMKKLRGKILISPLLSCSNFFGTRTFCSTAQKSSPAKLFGTSIQQNFRRKILILPPVLSKNLFASGNSETQLTRVFRDVFRHFETKKIRSSTEKLDSPRHSLIPKLFRYRKFYETQDRRVPCQTKFFRQKMLILPQSSVIQNISIPEIDETPKDSLLRYFSAL